MLAARTSAPANPLNLIRLVPAEGAFSRFQRTQRATGHAAPVPLLDAYDAE